MNWNNEPHWVWSKKLSDDHIRKLDYVIQNNYDKLEDPDVVAHGKVTTTKVISYNTLFQFKEVEELYNSAEFVASHNFGYNLFSSTKNRHAIYNEYYADVNGKYDWHIDCSNHPKWDIKMTFIINLSESFTGGEFQLYSGQEPNTITEFSEPGSMILFKSYTMHRVTPVTSGARRTLTFFFSGPALQ